MDHLKKDLIQPEVSTPISPDDIMTREKLKEFVDSIKISQTEAFFGCWNFVIYINSLVLDMPGPGFDRPVPHLTDPLGAFYEQHMAGAMEVVAMFYFARIPVDLLARAVEISRDSKIDPRVKVGISLLLSVVIASALELITHNGLSLHGGEPDQYDVIGNVLVGIYIAVGYQVIDYLCKSRETPIFDQWLSKISNLVKSSNEGLKQKIDPKFMAFIKQWLKEAGYYGVDEIAKQNQVKNIPDD
ncbi:MAG: hypothetical protein AAB612_04120 [Patescibacteria group bacterium]